VLIYTYLALETQEKPEKYLFTPPQTATLNNRIRPNVIIYIILQHRVSRCKTALALSSHLFKTNFKIRFQSKMFFLNFVHIISIYRQRSYRVLSKALLSDLLAGPFLE